MYKSVKGFTLLELLISLTILAMILVLIFSALRIGIRAWEKGEADIEMHQRRRTVLQLVKRQLSSIVVRKIKENGKKPFFLKGDDKSIEFVSCLSIVPGSSSGNVFVKYLIRAIDKGNGNIIEQLVFYEKKYLFLSEDEDTEALSYDSFYELFPGVRSISFEYLREYSNTQALEWLPKWLPEEEKRFPLAVKMRLQEKEDSDPIIIIMRIAPEPPD